jgi:putative nucleotidyltransferase with HDIG domain
VNHNLPFKSRTYVLTIGWIGMLPVVWAVWNLFTHPPHAAWGLLAVLALLNGPLSIRIPSMRATISVSEGVLFTSALLFGPAAATAVAAIDGLAVSLWSRKRSAMQTLFGVGEPAISVCLASLLFYRLAGVPPLLHHVTPFGLLLVPLLALTLVYFALNIVLAGTAVWLDAGGAPLLLLRRHLPNLALDCSVSLAASAAVIETSGSPAFAIMVVLVPMLLAGYISSHHTAGRLEDTNRHLAELRQLYDSTVETLAMAIDAKDQVTHGHIRRVQLFSTRLARALGATDREVQALNAAALLHDLGKLAVPEHILNKPGPLTPAEYQEMKKHAHVGASILSKIEFPFPVVPIVRHHHENWDGTGYPDGLKGSAIPMGARILAVIDCYDALTSDRPYRRRMTHEDALEIIRSRSGRMYDPAVVEAFVRVPPVADAESDPPEVDRRQLHSGVGEISKPTRQPVQSTGPTSSRQNHRARVIQFVTTLQGASWEDAGRAVATFIPKALPDSVAALFRLDPTTHQLVVAGMHHAFDARLPETVALGHGVTGWVGANKQLMVNSDAELDLGDIARMTIPPLRLCMSVPVVDRGEVVGVLTVYSPYAFSETDRMLVESLAEKLPSALCPAVKEAPSSNPHGLDQPVRGEIDAAFLATRAT